LGDYSKTPDNSVPLVERFNGRRWVLMPASNQVMSDVDVVSKRDVWVAGADVEHWDGTAWTTIPT